jgi:hypothetical protein
MSCWIPVDRSAPREPGWYPTRSNWRTATLHPGAKLWLGAKWASPAPERIEFFCPEVFEDPHSASSRAFDLEGGEHLAANANALAAPSTLAAAAG